MIGQDKEQTSSPGLDADLAFAETAVEAVFRSYYDPVRQALLELRGLILRTALDTAGVGPVRETLKWGQPSYLPVRPKTGSTVRIDAVRAPNFDFAMFVHCQTTLIEEFRLLYPDALVFQGKRAVLFSCADPLPAAALRHCVARAFTYHLKPSALRRRPAAQGAAES